MFCGLDYVRCINYCHLLSLSAVIYSGHGSNLKKFQLIHSVNAKNCKSGLMIKLRLTHPCHFTFAWSLWQKGVEAKENIVTAMMTDNILRNVTVTQTQGGRKDLPHDMRLLSPKPWFYILLFRSLLFNVANLAT